MSPHGIHKPDYYNRNKDKILAYNRKYQREHPEVVRKAVRKYQQSHPKMVKAHALSRNFPKGSRCDLCGSTKDLDKHHLDYDYPRIIVTLCKLCHRYIHRKEGEA